MTIGAQDITFCNLSNNRTFCALRQHPLTYLKFLFIRVGMVKIQTGWMGLPAPYTGDTLRLSLNPFTCSLSTISMSCLVLFTMCLTPMCFSCALLGFSFWC